MLTLHGRGVIATAAAGVAGRECGNAGRPVARASLEQPDDHRTQNIGYKQLAVIAEVDSSYYGGE